MAKFDFDTVARWRGMASRYLSEKHQLTNADVRTGTDAWTIAFRCGITEEAYRDREVYDAHIQTALERIFPNAVFKDKKVY